MVRNAMYLANRVDGLFRKRFVYQPFTGDGFLLPLHVHTGQSRRQRRCYGCEFRGGLFADAEGGEDAAEQVIGGEGPGDLFQRFLGGAQVFG